MKTHFPSPTPKREATQEFFKGSNRKRALMILSKWGQSTKSCLTVKATAAYPLG